MSRLRNLLIILALILGVGLLIPGSQAVTTKGSSLKFNSKKHTLYNPKTETIKDILTLAGSVSTDQVATIRFQNSGKLVWVGVKVGDKVKRGQAIASLDRAELRKNLATQFNDYRTELSKFTDTRDTYKDKVITDTIKRILDRTQYSLDNSVIDYELTDMAIKESILVSPIEGVVTAIDQPFAGGNITPATATFTIINPNNLYFQSEIDQEIVTQVHNGQSATITLDSYPNQTIDSKINYIAFTPVQGQTSTVYEIRFDLPLKNTDLAYRIGMDGDSKVTLASANNVLTIPTDAINDDNGQNYVYVKSNNELVRKNVEIGIESDTTIQIIKGLSTHDQVAIIQR